MLPWGRCCAVGGAKIWLKHSKLVQIRYPIIDARLDALALAALVVPV